MDGTLRRKRSTTPNKQRRISRSKRYRIGDLLLTRSLPFGETEPEEVLGIIVYVGKTLYQVQWFDEVPDNIQFYGDYAIRLYRKAYQEYRAENIDA